MRKWKKMISILTACTLLTGSMACYSTVSWAGVRENKSASEETEDSAAGEAESAVSKEAETDPNKLETYFEGQLALEDITSLNRGTEKVYSHNGRVTFVDGTCTSKPVTSPEDAAAVVNSMMALIGANAQTEFVPWRTITDALGNTYYIFQQMYMNTTVLGGAVKVITDADGKMLALSSSVESEMPEVDSEISITAREAQTIVKDQIFRESGVALEIYDQYTDMVVLPCILKFDIEAEDIPSRFVWVVYSNNPGSIDNITSDLPYLAHYVSMSGEYLYNIPAITPNDEASLSGSNASYVFEFMEPADYTGYVDLSNGEEKEITVTLMRDTRTGMYYLGNIERKIVVASCYDYLYNDGQIVLEASRDNLEWDQVGLLSLYNYCRAYDYYKEIGWFGGDGEETPILILNNFCDDHYNGINNAAYIGEFYGMQCFAASNINDLSQCLDVIAHEFTHCVTGSVMTYNSYVNDYGAINEALSDIQGKNCQMMAGDVEPTDWTLGSLSLTPARDMANPHLFAQPDFTWDIYYMSTTNTPTASNDYGGVHLNSSLLNRIYYMLITEGGMSLEEARLFWFVADCAMVPQTDYVQVTELLPWVLKVTGMEQYADTLKKAIAETRLSEKELPTSIGDDRAIVTLNLPDTEAFDTCNWNLLLTTIDVEGTIDWASELASDLMEGDFSALPQFLQDFISEEQEKAEETSALEKTLNAAGSVVSLITDTVSHFITKGDTKAAEELQPSELVEDNPQLKVLIKEIQEWLRIELLQLVYTSIGIAGQDGSTVNMVVLPGHCIPVLQHATFGPVSDQPDQVVIAIYINGKWYDLKLNDLYGVTEENTEEVKDSLNDFLNQVLTDLFGKNLEGILAIQSPEDLLDYLAIEVKGGEILELSSEGLDQIVIPEPTPFEEKEFGTLTPGKMSRPKLDDTAVDEAA